MSALLLAAIVVVSGCAGSGQQSGSAAVYVGCPPSVPDPIMHGYHPTTWRDLADERAGSEIEFSVDPPAEAIEAIETLPAPAMEKRKPPPGPHKQAPTKPKRTGTLRRKVPRAAAAKTSGMRMPRRKVARDAATRSSDAKPLLPLNAESLSRQPSDIARAAVAQGEAQGERIAAHGRESTLRAERTIATMVPRKPTVQTVAALTPVTTMRHADLAHAARVAPLSRPRKEQTPPAASPPKPATTLWRPAPKRPSSAQSADAPAPPQAFASSPVRDKPPILSGSLPAGERVVQASLRQESSATGKAAATVRLVAWWPRPAADSPAMSRLSVAVRAAPASEIRIVRFLAGDPIVLGRPKTQNVRPGPALRIISTER